MAITKAQRYHELTSEVPGIDRLRAYLADWQEWEGRYKVDLGAPNAVSWARYMKTAKPSGDNEDTGCSTINEPAMRIIDASVDELAAKSRELQLCLRWRYLNINVAVFRLKRLEGRSMEDLDELADAAEVALLPIARRRGLIL